MLAFGREIESGREIVEGMSLSFATAVHPCQLTWRRTCPECKASIQHEFSIVWRLLCRCNL